jgi:hypothetical protein
MTLSILDETGCQILKVDMLRHDTMKANLDGSRLVRALNDLTVLASLPDLLAGQPGKELPYPDDGISDGPWLVACVDSKRSLTVRIGGRVFAERRFAASQLKQYKDIKRLLQNGHPVLPQLVAHSGNSPIRKPRARKP